MAKKPTTDAPATKPAKAKPRGEWRSLHLWQIQGVRDVLVFLGVLGLLWLGHKISVVTVPLLLAILLAYLFEPVICWVMKKTGFARQRAVTAVMAAVLILVLLPAALGLTFGVVQSVDWVKSTSDKVTDVGTAGFALQRSAALGDRLAEVEQAVEYPAEGQVPPSTKELDDLRQQLATLEAEMPVHLQTLRQLDGVYGWVAEFVFGDPDDQSKSTAYLAVENWLRANADQFATASSSAVRSTIGFFGSLFGLLFMAFITAFFFFFIATEWVKVKGFGTSLLPEKNRELVIDLATKFDRVISAFIRGRLTIAFIQSIIFTIGYLIIGVPAAFLLGPIVAILSIVPYLALIGVPVSIVLLATRDHDGFRDSWLWILAAPTAIYFIGQALDDYLLTPKIQGKSTGMDTPTILFASMAGGVLFGVFGLLIAIPIAACLKILIQEVFWPKFKAWAEGREKDFLPIGRE